LGGEKVSIEKDMQRRLEEIKEQTLGLRSGSVCHEIYQTEKSSSFASYMKASFKAGLIPFYKAKFEMIAEKILFVDIPVDSPHTRMLNLALPYSHAGLVSHEHPMQLSCETRAKIPCTVIQYIKGYDTEMGEDDPLFRVLRNDDKMKKLRLEALYGGQYADSDERIKILIEWIIQFVPLGSSTLCILNTGSKWEGVFNKHRVYNLELRLKLLERLMEDVHEVGYIGEPKAARLYAPVYQLVRPGLVSL
jgi:hypothetical protein